MTIIQDGSGKGYKAKVSKVNRLFVEASIVDLEDEAIRTGDGYQITSKPVSFTGANTSAILYIENTNTLDFVLDRAVLILSTATGGSGDWTFQILRNPTSGTIVDNAVAAGISNSNHGSGKTPDAICYLGVENDTLVDGTGVPLKLRGSESRLVFPLGRRLPTGASIGFKVTPPPSTTSASVVLVTHFYFDTSGG